MKAVILANGKFPSNPDLIALLKSAEFLAVCDGAVVYLDSLNICPNVVIGDLDSISQEHRQKYESYLVHIEEQLSNDLSKAFFHCLALGYDEFIILGATGKREDHALANIFLLPYFQKHCQSVVMLSDFGSFSAHSTPFCLQTKKGTQISLFALDSKVPLSSQGLKYPLKNLCLEYLFSGSLNEALGESFSLTSPLSTEMIVYQSLI